MDEESRKAYHDHQGKEHDRLFGKDMLTRYKRALEGLTPGGSEFVDDPERCAAVVRSSSEGIMSVLTKRVKQLNALMDLMQYVLKVGHIYPDDTPEKINVVFGHPSIEDWTRIFLEARKAKYILDGKL